MTIAPLHNPAEMRLVAGKPAEYAAELLELRAVEEDRV
jgi:hypothetical protein